MIQRRLSNPLAQSIDSDEVRQKSVGQINAQEKIDNVFRNRTPRRNILFVPTTTNRSIKETLDRPNQKLHVNSLRASPPAPDSTEERRKQHDAQQNANQENRKQKRVRRQESESKNRETPGYNVQQNERLASHFDEGQHRENCDQKIGESPSSGQQLSLAKFRLQPTS
jgi:hypothetical protein